MIAIISELINEAAKTKFKGIEINKLLEAVELKLGGDRFELAGGYAAFASAIEKLSTIGRLSPVKSNGINYMSPPLYAKYRIIEDIASRDQKDYISEILSLHPMLKKDYYLKHIEHYEADRAYISCLNKYLQTKGIANLKKCRPTLNERSFELFNDEKFLDKQGKTLLKRLGMDIENLNCYRTFEAFFYIFIESSSEGNILIIENKDSFMSLLRAMNPKDNSTLNRSGIKLLIYGEGNKITKSFEFMEELSREFRTDKVFYFGDIDYPGIDIYQRLRENFPKYNIIPHTILYEQLLNKVDQPPKARNTVKHDIGMFLGYFDKKIAREISTILEGNGYIPQEGLSFADGEFEI